MAHFDRAAFVKHFLDNGFSADVAEHEANKGERLHNEREAALLASVERIAADKAEDLALQRSYEYAIRAGLARPML